MLDLKVEVPGEPVIEERLLNVTAGECLHRHPVVLLVVVDLHWNVVHLGDQREPVALNEPEHEVTKRDKLIHLYSEKKSSVVLCKILDGNSHRGGFKALLGNTL